MNCPGQASDEQLIVPWPDLGVIVITRNSEGRTAELARHLKSARFIHKPSSMAKLSDEIRTALGER